MDRYTININHPGAEPVLLLIPFPPTSTIQNLVNEIRRRASRVQLLLPDQVSLHLGGENGPLLDEEDAVEDVVLDPKTEVITVVWQAPASGAVAQARILQVSVQYSALERPNQQLTSDHATAGEYQTIRVRDDR